jgi:RNA polymerase sigma factor for flagellar operon FliA
MQATLTSTDCKPILDQFAPLVQRMARQLVSRLPASVDFDDMVQAGMIGLLDATRRYEDGHGAKFETFATQRVRGAMLDELRQNDWAPRGVRRNRRSIESAIRSLEQRLGRPPREGEIARELEMTLAQYGQFVAASCTTDVVSYDELSGGDGEAWLARQQADEGLDPAVRLEERRTRKSVTDSIDSLPAREREVLELYHDRDLNYKEIAAILRVSESRVSQLHTQAVERLRASHKDLS